MKHTSDRPQKKRSTHSSIKLTAAALFAAAALTLRLGARRIPGFAEAAALRISPLLRGTLGRLSALFPFSVAELLILFLILAILLRLPALLIAVIRKKAGAPRRLLAFMSTLLLIASWILLLYEAGEDIYFYRTPFSEREGLGRGSYTTEELLAVCKSLTVECNDLAALVERSADGLMILSGDAPERVTSAMEETGRAYPMLAGRYVRPKAPLFSVLMSMTDMAGIYSAYTCEAHYNRCMPDYNKPFTMCHELAHTHGELHEDEANFIAYLTCRNVPDPDIRYSGLLLGWIYCANELARRDKSAHSGIYAALAPSVLADLDDNSAFWEKYKSLVSESAQSFNDRYLKSHGISSGKGSYDRVVDLIVSYEMTHSPGSLPASTRRSLPSAP